MAKNKISDLCDHLFETLEALKDPDKPMDLDRAYAVVKVAGAIIESAKVEVDLVKAINERALETVRPGSTFFDAPAASEKSAPRPALVAAAGKSHA